MKINENYKNLEESYLFSTIAKKVDEYTKAHPEAKVIKMGIGDVTLPICQKAADAFAKAAMEQGKAATFHGYGPEQGYDFLRVAVQKYYASFQVEVAAEDIFISDGAKSDVGNILDLFDADNTVLIPDPVYPVYMDTNVMAGRKIVFMDANVENGFLPMPPKGQKADIIYLCSPNNPTGAVWKPETVEAIGRWAVEHHIWVISDEIYEHLNYDDAHTTYIGAAVPECRGQLLVLNGVAKTYAMPGWRVGWMVAPLEVAKAATKLQGHMTSNVANISQRAALAAVAGPLDEVHEMRKAFDARRRAIVTALNDIEGVNCPTPTGAFYAFADIAALLGKPLGPKGTVSDTSADFAAALLDEAHVAAVPGEAFGAPGYLRFSYALADEDLAEGMRRFKEWAN